MITLWDIVKLNFMWLVFSLPIITIGASTVAAFSVTLKMVEDKEGRVVHQFIESFKENWKHGIILGLITLVGIYSAYINFQLFNTDGNPIIFLILSILIIFIGLVHLIYAFPLAARYKNSLVGTLQNAKEISFKFFLRTMLMWILVALLCVVFIYNVTLMFVGLLVGPVSIFLTISAFSMRFFRQIEKDMQSA